MSWQDRRYDTGEPRRFFRDDRPLGTWWIIGVTTAVALVTFIVGGGIWGARFHEIAYWFGVSPAGLAKFQIWRPLTALFLHGGVGHLLFNMLAVFFIGGFIESRLGTKYIVRLYLTCGVLANLACPFDMLLSGGPADRSAIGASGAVMGLVAFFGTRFASMMIYFWGIIPIRAWALAVILVALDVLSIFANRGQEGVARSVHLAGAFVGFAIAALWPKFRAKFDDWRSDLDAQKERRVREKARQENVELDRILGKISEKGMDQLSDTERRFLNSQSEKRKRG